MNYLVLFSSVFVFINEKNVLLYDSKSSKHLKYTDSNILAIFNSRISKGLNVFKVNEHSAHFFLFDDITNNNMGWVASNTKKIPFQIAPIVSINHTVFNEEGSPISKTLSESNWNITKLNIHLDGNIQWLSNPLHPIKQTIFCDAESEISDRIDAQLLMNKLEYINKLIYLQEVNIICNRPDLYSEYNHLIDFLYSSLRKQVKLYLVIDAIFLDSHAPYFKKLLYAYENVFIKAIIPPQKTTALHHENLFKKFAENRCRFIKMVYSEIDLYSDSNYQHVPVYNGDNLDFFEKNVFLNKNDICNQTLTMQDIFRRENLNEFYFGNLTILFNGYVYNNINRDCIGNLFQHSLQQLLLLISNNNSWFLTRNKINPCNKCIYCFLCPPISNYEFAFNRFNLCKCHVQ